MATATGTFPFTSETTMPDTFDEMLDRIDRTSPSFNETLPALVLLFKLHENKIAALTRQIEEARATEREQLAEKIFIAVLQSGKWRGDTVADYSFRLADAFIAKRDKERTNDQ